MLGFFFCAILLGKFTRSLVTPTSWKLGVTSALGMLPFVKIYLFLS
ncbi:hypothetical protein IQ10_02105 [Halalkalibacter nanhaiisediminis]|uniref:Uncharacterized protein n=1 Tax=Halalkalibacter nanhaiisediminis TaxID=688079 RepID=A0A562QHJ5_9BACI|nr:hypothetical protein IQ10_02105 [Halalkalibacter nanhaiisediminis]